METGWTQIREIKFSGAQSARLNPKDGAIYVGRRASSGGLYRVDAFGLETKLTSASNPAALAVAASGDVFFSEDVMLPDMIQPDMPVPDLTQPDQLPPDQAPPDTAEAADQAPPDKTAALDAGAAPDTGKKLDGKTAGPSSGSEEGCDCSLDPAAQPPGALLILCLLALLRRRARRQHAIP